MADKKISELTALTSPDGAEELVVNDSGVSKKIAIENLFSGDNVKAKFGASDDLQIYHDGNNSYVKDTGTGNLNIGGYDSVKITNPDGTNVGAVFNTAGAVDLNYNNSQKLATTSTGIDVTGSITCDGFTSTGIDDNATGEVMSLSDSRMDVLIPQYIQSTSQPQLELAYNSGNIVGFYRSGGSFTIKNDNGAGTPESSISLHEDGAVTLFYDNSPKLSTTSTGIDVTGSVTSSSSFVFKNGVITSSSVADAFSFTLDDLPTLTGSFRHRAFVEVTVYAGESNQSNTFLNKALISIVGLSSYNLISVTNIVGTLSASISTSTTTGITVDIDQGNANSGGVIMMASAKDSNPSLTIAS